MQTRSAQKKKIILIASVALIVIIAIIILISGNRRQENEPVTGFPEFPEIDQNFPDSPVDEVSGRIEIPSGGQVVELDLSSEEAQRHASLFREEFSKPANYSGHYRLVEVSCGEDCSEFYALDKNNGAVIRIPDGIITPGTGGTGGTNGTGGTGTGTGNTGNTGNTGGTGTGNGNGDRILPPDFENGNVVVSNNPKKWSDESFGFNILSDIGAVIALEKEYQAKLIQQVDLADRVVYTIYALDQCIPGPRPDWEADAEVRLEEIKNFIPSDWRQWDNMSGLLKGLIGFFGNNQAVLKFQKVAGLFTGNSADDVHNQLMYQAILLELFGMDVNRSGSSGKKIQSRGQITTLLDTMYDGYRNAVNTLYSDNERPDGIWLSLTDIWWPQIKRYEQGMIETNAQIRQSTVLIYTLENSILKRIVNNLPSGIPTRSDPDYGDKIKAYEAALSPSERDTLDAIKRSFLRIAPDLHTDKNLAEANDTLADLTEDEASTTSLVNDCIATTTAQGYGKIDTRLPYPNYAKYPIGNPSNLPVDFSYLPGWSYFPGSGVGTPEQKIAAMIALKKIMTENLVDFNGIPANGSVSIFEQMLLVF